MMFDVHNNLTGVTDFKHSVNHQILDELEDDYYEEPHIVCPAFQSLAESILANHGLARPENLVEALEVFHSCTDH